MSDYDLFAKKYHEDAKNNLLSSNNLKLKRDLIERAQLNLNKIENLLIIGGAGGIEVQFIIENLSNIQNITSIDISSKLIKLAKKEFPSSKINYVVSKMETLPFSDSIFDFIYSRNTLHYSSNLDSTFAESFRVLRKRGRMYFVVAHPTWMLFHKSSKNYLDKNKIKLNIQSGQISVEHFAYSISDYVNSICKVGFKIVELSEYEGTRSNIRGYNVPTGLAFKLEKDI